MKEIIGHLDVSRDTVLSWTEKYNKVPTRTGCLLKFRISDVDAWIEARGTIK